MKFHAKFKLAHLNISTFTVDLTAKSPKDAQKKLKLNWPEAKNVRIKRG